MRADEPAIFLSVVALDAGWPVIAPVQALALALALSVAGNAALGWAWLNARDARQAAVLQRDSARADASACSDATDDLRTLADQRSKDAATARTAAANAARTHAQRADATLATAPTVPGDMCASLQVLGDEWLKERGQ